MNAPAEVVDELVELLRNVLPEADSATLSAHVVNLRLRRPAAGELLGYLRNFPDALTSGHSGSE
ncbi:hypothetical protein ACH4FE_28735 [Streptomyces celluloflavus]|uniref:hypothetical protein n=1 Tax=Streptomyces celluloflavus TaxID=58344 RepID=UPI0037899540